MSRAGTPPGAAEAPAAEAAAPLLSDALASLMAPRQPGTRPGTPEAGAAPMPAIFHLKTEAYPTGNREFLSAEVMPALRRGFQALAAALEDERMRVVSGADWERPEAKFRPVDWKPIEPLTWLGEYLRDELAREKAEAEAAAAAAVAAEMRAAALAALPPTVVFVLGGPGSGKGTQCERIVRDYSFVHLSAGDLLRAEVASGSDLGLQCDALMKEGALVPMEVTIGLLKAAMDAAPVKRFLIDGFPRALDQAEAFEASVQPCSFVLFFDCPLETMEQRLLKRGETSGRSDDNLEAIKKRFDTFTNQSLPVIDYFSALGKAFSVSSVPPPDEVYAEVHAIFEGQLFPPPPPVEQPTVVFVVGGPGSGKSTQCARLVEEFSFTLLSLGDLLRAEAASGSELGLQFEALMKEGQLVPMETCLGLLKAAMDAAPAKRFLIDGFPRALDQGLVFERELCPCSYILHFDCPAETAEGRLHARAETSGRVDDNPESIRKVIDTFTRTSLPVIEYYAIKGKVRPIPAGGEPDAVYAAVREVVMAEPLVPMPLPQEELSYDE